MGATEWVGVSFLLFVALLVYLKVPGLIASMLDARSEEIKKQLDEARDLRNEAETLLSRLQKEQKDTARQIKEITDLAAEEAEIQSKEARAALEASIERRSRLAQEKIAQAEAHAVQEVRDVVVTVATEAARDLIADALKGTKKTAMVDEAIGNLDKKGSSLH